MSSPSVFTVAELKEKLRGLGLSTIGPKAKLISRLIATDPNSNWANTLGNTGVEESDVELRASCSTSSEPKVRDSGTPSESETIRREMELLRREKELAKRELRFLQRENEALRNPSQSGGVIQSLHSSPNIQTIANKLDDFNGSGNSFWRWEQKVKLLCTLYKLDDVAAKAFVTSKLKGTALDWFHSKPEHIIISLGDLLEGLKNMFDHRLDKLALRKQFEERIWRSGEAFSRYYHDKVIIANQVPIDEEEIVDYVIDGIPNAQLQSQARMHCFPSKASLFKAFEKIPLHPEPKSRFHRDSSSKGEVRNIKIPYVKEGSGNQRSTIRCYNCQQYGHRLSECKQPREGRWTCYRCGKQGHIARDCSSAAGKERVHHVYGKLAEEDEFRRNIVYQISNDDVVCNLTLDTLIDTGSPVSFIKEQFLPNEIIEEADSSSNRFCGINNVKLITKGIVEAKITHDGVTKDRIRLLVVPSSTMLSSVVLGRDTLNEFGLTLNNRPAEDRRDDMLQEIMNIDLDGTNKSQADALAINTEISNKVRLQVQNMFVKEYFEPVRPDEPKVNLELTITLYDHKPFHCTPRRLSYAEKGQLRLMLDNLLRKGIIQSSESEYASPIVMVKKKNGEYRMCVDFRILNKAIARDNYPLPLIEDQLDILCNKKYFSLLDLKDGFHHVKVAEGLV